MKGLTEEKKYEQLRRLGQELHIPIPEHFLELEVTDKNGKVIQTLKQRSHSWQRNAYNLLLSEMAAKNLDDAGVFGAGLLSMKDTSAAIKDGAYGGYVWNNAGAFETVGYGARAGAAITLFGIQVGSDATAWDFEQFKLLVQIAEGTAPGALNHVAMNVPTKSWAAPVFTITWIRYLNNNTAPPGDVLVKEVGLVYSVGISGAFYYMMMSRDKLGATVTIPNTGQLKVTYTIQLSYP